jgi:hypothetical protein
MTSMNSAESRPRRTVPAPLPTHPGLRPLILDVECAEDEEIVWLWTDTAAGSVVSGYQVVPRQSSQRVAQLCSVS